MINAIVAELITMQNAGLGQVWWMGQNQRGKKVPLKLQNFLLAMYYMHCKK
jgi:hypothetical protein